MVQIVAGAEKISRPRRYDVRVVRHLHFLKAVRLADFLRFHYAALGQAQGVTVRIRALHSRLLIDHHH